MNSALLHNGKVVTAADYNVSKHGVRLTCIDKGCKASLIFVPGSETSVPYFKTTGRSDESKHAENCGFFKPLSFEESILKVEEYQSDLLEQGVQETVIRLNLNNIDPDHVKKEIDREEPEYKVKNPNEIKVKQESATPNSITSLKAIVKLLTSYEPDTLASILISAKGQKIPLSEMVLSLEKAHNLLWDGKLNDSLSYFVYGTIEQVLRRDKVIYVNLQEKNTSEIIIKSNKYLEFLKTGIRG